MRKMIVMLLLAFALCVTGCGNEAVETTQESQKTEELKDNENTVAENTEQNTESEQNTVSNDANIDETGAYDDYMTSIKEQSDGIKASLENDALTQYDMNMQSQELYELWDGALNYLWGELKNKLPEDEFAKLLDEQRTWISEKEKTVEEAGKEVEGGSMHPLVVNSKAASITEERVYELYELLK